MILRSLIPSQDYYLSSVTQARILSGNTILFALLWSPHSQAENFQCEDFFDGKIVLKDRKCESFERTVITIRTDVVTPNSAIPKPIDENLLQNPSFEYDVNSWNVPDGVQWMSDGGVNRSGGLVVHAEKPPDDSYIYETEVSQCVPLGRGSRFVLTAKIRLEGLPVANSSNRANVSWFESENCTTGGQYGNYIEPKPTVVWQELERKNLIPALGAIAAKITIVQNGRFSNGYKAFWDDVSFRATAVDTPDNSRLKPRIDPKFTKVPGVNYLHNGSFDNDLRLWRAGWPAEWVGTEGDTDRGAAKIMSRSDEDGIGMLALSQCVNFGGNKSFELGASFKIDERSTQSGGGRLRLTWYQDTWCEGRAKAGQWTDPYQTSGWERLLIKGLIAPPDSQSAQIELIQSIKGKGNFTTYWDDVHFAAVK